MTLEEYQAELRRISETLAEQNREFDQVTAVLRDYPQIHVNVDPTAIAAFDDAFQFAAAPPSSAQRGLRC